MRHDLLTRAPVAGTCHRRFKLPRTAGLRTKGRSQTPMCPTGRQRRPRTRSHCNPEPGPPAPGAAKWSKSNRTEFSLPFFVNHEGDGLETSGWDGHRGEARASWDSLVEKDTPAPWPHCDRWGAADPKYPRSTGLETVSRCFQP